MSYETDRKRANKARIKGLKTFSIKNGRWYRLELNNLKESITDKIKISGVYVLFINDELRYIGESENLISRLNQHIGNMYMYLAQNTRVIIKIKAEGYGEDRKEIERIMISRLNPPGNKIREDTFYEIIKKGRMNHGKICNFNW